MKIVEMERRTLDGGSIVYDELNECAEEYRDWWGVIETEEEKLMYDAFLNGDNAGEEGDKLLRTLWNNMVKHAGLGLGLKWGDDDVYGYIMPHERVPEAGEEYVDTYNDKWVRTK